MRRFVIRAVGAAVLLSACSSGGSGVATATSTSIAPRSTTTASTTIVTTTVVSTTTPHTPPSANPPPPTTAPCPSTGSTSAQSTTGSHASALLHTVSAATAPCADRVVFGFSVKGFGTPSCRVGYEPGPFSQDASDAPVKVAGTAFVVVRCSPASGFDFETSKPTYTGPKQIEPPQTAHVVELVQIGDNEGVLSWVVGLDARRPFRVEAQTTPPGLSVVAITFT